MFNLTGQRAQHIDAVQSPCLDKSSFKDSFAYCLLPTQLSIRGIHLGVSLFLIKVIVFGARNIGSEASTKKHFAI